MKLQQAQVWKQDNQYIRIIRVERLAVEYKISKDLMAKEGTHHQATKKEFCRLLKNAVLLSTPKVQSP